MGRPKRHDPAGAFYHVVNRGAARQDVFRTDQDRVEFERLLGVVHERFGVQVHAYCLMTNHYHLLLECPDGGLSDAMHLVASNYVRHHNARSGRDGPLFRDRFFAKQVTSDAYIGRLARYIHRNPVAIVGEAGLTGFRWSSLRSYLGARQLLPWLQVGFVLEIFGGRDRLLRATLAPQLEMAPVTAREDLRAAVELMMDEHEIGDGPRVGRTIYTLLLDHDGVGEAAAGLLDGAHDRSAEARKQARRRARRRAEDQPELGRVVEEVLRLVT